MHSHPSTPTLMHNQVTVALIDLTPEFHYISVPRLSPHSFLQAKAKNSSPYTMLTGPANIFLDNNFIAKVSAHLASKWLPLAERLLGFLPTIWYCPQCSSLEGSLMLMPEADNTLLYSCKVQEMIHCMASNVELIELLTVMISAITVVYEGAAAIWLRHW